MKVTVSDLVSPSYFPLTAAVELGFFKEEGIDAEVVAPIMEGLDALADGRLDFLGSSAYLALQAFPNWQGGKLLCALSQHTYWFLAMRSDLKAKKGDVNAVKGHRLSASPGPSMLLEQMLIAAGIDLERDNVKIVLVPRVPGKDYNLARIGLDAIESGAADGFWGNALRIEMARKRGLVEILLDIRRGDGPAAARDFTFPALMVSDRLINDHPAAAAGAVRAVVKAQRALAADPSLAGPIGQKLFPPEEASLIVDLIARDTPFYDASISEEKVVKLNEFAMSVGMLSGPVPYEQVVATQFKDLWRA